MTQGRDVEVSSHHSALLSVMIPAPWSTCCCNKLQAHHGGWRITAISDPHPVVVLRVSLLFCSQALSLNFVGGFRIFMRAETPAVLHTHKSNTHAKRCLDNAFAVFLWNWAYRFALGSTGTCNFTYNLLFYNISQRYLRIFLNLGLT